MLPSLGLDKRHQMVALSFQALGEALRHINGGALRTTLALDAASVGQ